MSDSKDFEKEDRRAATNFADAARKAGVYGPVDEDPDDSAALPDSGTPGLPSAPAVHPT